MSNDLHPKWIKEAWQEEFLEMKANPADQRTNKDFCKEHDICESVLYLWTRKNRVGVSYEVDRRRKEFVSDIRAKAWKALDQKLGKDTKAIELAFKLIGDFVERSEQKIDYMRPEDKIERIKQLLAQVSTKKASEGDASRSSEGCDSGVNNKPGDRPA